MTSMATIRPNDNAPAEDVKYIFPTATFDIASGGSYETDDRAILSAAEDHPWLDVEYPEVPEEVAVTREPKSVPYQDDVLAAVNSKAFDLDLVRQAEEEKTAVFADHLAIQAGLTQTEPVTEGGIDQTLAAADESSTADNEKPASRRRGRAAANEEG